MGTGRGGLRVAENGLLLECTAAGICTPHPHAMHSQLSTGWMETVMDSSGHSLLRSHTNTLKPQKR